MNIGIDVDDTISITGPIVYKFIEKNMLNSCSSKVELEEKCRLIMRGIINEEEKAFFYKNMIQIAKEISIKEDASKVISNLKNMGHNIFIITSRSDKNYGNAYAITKEWLDRNNVMYDHIICNSDEKVEACKVNSIDIMIDDSLHICNKLKEIGINPILVTSIFNEKQETDIYRVNDWNEIESYFINLAQKEDVAE